MADTKLARELPKFILRFSEELRGKIKAAAEKNKRSMTAEIVSLIEQGFEQREHEEWLEARYREIQEEDPDEVYEHHLRGLQEEKLEKREQELRALPVTHIVPPDGMSQEEFSALLTQALEGSNRYALELFQSMIVKKGGSVVPLVDDEDKP